MTARTNEELRDRTARWRDVIRPDSDLYSRLASHVMEAPLLLDLLRLAPPGQIEMNLLLASVQYLLFENPRDPLARWYPSLGGTGSGAGLEAEFDRFVASHRDRIAGLIANQRVQTNEVARCGFLLPAYNLVQARADGAPLAIVEVGTSAGLIQNVDRYGYTFRAGPDTTALNPAASVQLTVDCSPRIPEAAQRVPAIAWRCGLDLNPIDVSDPAAARWLRSLLWADQVERHRRLEAAIEVAVAHPPRLISGDALDALPAVVAEAPGEAALVVQHSYVLNQFSATDRERFITLLDDIADARPVFRVGAEALVSRQPSVLEIARHGADRDTRRIAEVHHHGEWIRFADSLQA